MNALHSVLLRYRSALLLALCMLAPASRAAAGGGAWNKDDGDYYVKVALSWLTADKQFGADGRPELIFNDAAFRNGKFGVTDISFYGELGLNRWLTMVGSTQVKVAVREGFYQPSGRDSNASASGLCDIWLGGRVRLLPEESKYVAALTLSVKVPTGSPLQSIPLGTGVVDYEAAAAAGTSFQIPVAATPIYGYAQLSAGYRLRNGAASNEMNYAAEVGVNMNEALTLQAVMDGVHSFADFSNLSGEPGVANELVGDQSFLRWNVAVIYGLNKRMDLNLGYTWNSSGRNTLLLSGLSAGIAWRR